MLPKPLDRREIIKTNLKSDIGNLTSDVLCFVLPKPLDRREIIKTNLKSDIGNLTSDIPEATTSRAGTSVCRPS